MDDRDVSPGFKMKDADLIGYPYKIIISDNTLAQGNNMVERISRKTGESEIVDYTKL